MLFPTEHFDRYQIDDYCPNGYAEEFRSEIPKMKPIVGDFAQAVA